VCRRISSRVYTAEKTELWDRWQRGESLKAIGRAFGGRGLEVSFAASVRISLSSVRSDTARRRRIFRLKLLEPLNHVALKAAILIAPPIVRYFRHVRESWGAPSETGTFFYEESDFRVGDCDIARCGPEVILASS
jgi:hypothetical protein